MPIFSGVEILSPAFLSSETWNSKSLKELKNRAEESDPVKITERSLVQDNMLVLCLGLGRTGTVSLRIALSELGYKPYHGYSLIENPPDALLWRQALDSKYEGKGKPWQKQDFDRVFAGSDACLDIPASVFVEELIGVYQDAKVICTIRDVDSWYDSWRATIRPKTPPSLRQQVFSKIMLSTDRASGLYIPLMEDCVRYKYGGAFNREEDGRRAKQIYENHVRTVQTLAPDCLMYYIRDGWEPLCKFLGKEIPRDEKGFEKPFPRLNDRRQWHEIFGTLMDGIVAKQCKRWIIFACWIGLGILGVSFSRS